MFGTPSQAKILSIIEENCSQECFGDVAKLRTPLSHSLFSSSLVINPRCMREGYGSQSVCVCVCLSVTTLTATYLIFTSIVRCLRVLYGVFQICSVWLLLKILLFKSSLSFADHRSLPRSLTSYQSTKESAMASFQYKECIQLAITSTTRLTNY